MNEEKRKARWEQEQVNRSKTVAIELERATTLLAINKLELEIAGQKLDMMVAQTKYWSALAVHPGEHDALFKSVLTEVQLMRKDLKDVVRGRTSNDSD